MSYWDSDKKREWLKKMESMPPDERQKWQREIDIRDLEERLGVVAQDLRSMAPERAARVIEQIRQEQEHFETKAAEKELLDARDGADPDRETEWEKQQDFVMESQRRYILRAKEGQEQERLEPDRAQEAWDRIQEQHKGKEPDREP